MLTGRAEWLDSGQNRCLVHWSTSARWADLIYAWVRARLAVEHRTVSGTVRTCLRHGPLQVKEHGMQDAVMTLEELVEGDDTRGAGAPVLIPRAWLIFMLTARCPLRPADFHGMHKDALLAALRHMELDGRAKCVLL